MKQHNSMSAVYAALSSNIFISISKFIVSFITGSTTMLAESIHSTADSFNQILLLIGNKRSNKEADETHSFGYGKEEYFWGMLVAVVLFSLGSIFAIYEGIHKIIEPLPVLNAQWIYLILILSILAEGKSFLFAMKEFKKKLKENPKKEIKQNKKTKDKIYVKMLKFLKIFTIYNALKKSTETSLVVIIIEDSAAVLGLIIGLIFTLLSVYVNPVFDGIGSIIIGSILGYMSYFLSNELRTLIVGESISREMRNTIKNILKEYEVIEHINNIRSMYIGRNKFLLNISINVDADKRSGDIESIVFEIKNDIRKIYYGAEYINIEISEPKNI